MEVAHWVMQRRLSARVSELTLLLAQRSRRSSNQSSSVEEKGGEWKLRILRLRSDASTSKPRWGRAQEEATPIIRQRKTDCTCPFRTDVTFKDALCLRHGARSGGHYLLICHRFGLQSSDRLSHWILPRYRSSHSVTSVVLCLVTFHRFRTHFILYFPCPHAAHLCSTPIIFLTHFLLQQSYQVE